jgi:hypothetical protein
MRAGRVFELRHLALIGRREEAREHVLAVEAPRPHAFAGPLGRGPVVAAERQGRVDPHVEENALHLPAGARDVGHVVGAGRLERVVRREGAAFAFDHHAREDRHSLERAQRREERRPHEQPPPHDLAQRRSQTFEREPPVLRDVLEPDGDLPRRAAAVRDVRHGRKAEHGGLFLLLRASRQKIEKRAPADQRQEHGHREEGELDGLHRA